MTETSSAPKSAGSDTVSNEAATKPSGSSGAPAPQPAAVIPPPDAKVVKADREELRIALLRVRDLTQKLTVAEAAVDPFASIEGPTPIGPMETASGTVQADQARASLAAGMIEVRIAKTVFKLIDRVAGQIGVGL